MAKTDTLPATGSTLFTDPDDLGVEITDRLRRILARFGGLVPAVAGGDGEDDKDDKDKDGRTDDDRDDADDDGKDDNLPEAARDVLRKARKAARDAEKARKQAERDRDEAQTKVREFEDAGKSEKERLETRATTAEREAETAKRTALRYQVADDKGLKLTMAKRLNGETSKEQMEKDADAAARRSRRRRQGRRQQARSTRTTSTRTVSPRARAATAAPGPTRTSDAKNAPAGACRAWRPAYRERAKSVVSVSADPVGADRMTPRRQGLDADSRRGAQAAPEPRSRRASSRSSCSRTPLLVDAALQGHQPATRYKYNKSRQTLPGRRVPRRQLQPTRSRPARSTR
jgi:hypothetical protein